jgi:tRNA(adenine34) deaminase
MREKMDDICFMRQALELARESLHEGEVPVGAVVVKNGVVIGTGRNRRELNKNALAHAEIEAIDNACKRLGGWRLWECELYVTLEPCPMCAGAIINSRLRRVVFGAYDKKAGSCSSVINLFALPYNHRPEVAGGVMENECSTLLSEFFKQLRAEKAKENQI